jgi:hypothetical protein
MAIEIAELIPFTDLGGYRGMVSSRAAGGDGNGRRETTRYRACQFASRRRRWQRTSGDHWLQGHGQLASRRRRWQRTSTVGLHSWRAAGRDGNGPRETTRRLVTGPWSTRQAGSDRPAHNPALRAESALLNFFFGRSRSRSRSRSWIRIWIRRRVRSPGALVMLPGSRREVYCCIRSLHKQIRDGRSRASRGNDRPPGAPGR